MDAFFNKHLSKGKNVVENVLGVFEKDIQKTIIEKQPSH